MEIVIKIHDIPKNDHERWALTHGTPLPKGHGKLIDVSKLSYECMHEKSSECNHMMCDTCQFNCVAKYEIEDAPTIIEADEGGEDEADN